MNRHLALGAGAIALGYLLLQPVTAMADPPAHARNENSAKHRGYSGMDSRHWDDQQYHPRRGYVVHRLPPGPRVVHHHGNRYYYSRGAWYRPYGPEFVVVDPPVGLVVSFLPEVHATMYFGGVPYYRAGPVFYVWNPRARGYVVTDRPYRGW